MGNEAIALGAIKAGVRVVCGYPGTPSTEILETVAKNNDGSIYTEWSVNEKTAMEVAAGAAYSGARAMVTMKQVGLNVASDPLMSLVYIGVKGGLVIVVADDPGPLSSQTEQDTRHFAKFANLPVLDPSTPEEAYEMVQAAFELSEQVGLPVILRPTTRICHACSSIDVSDTREEHVPAGFEKDSRWVIFPQLSYKRHIETEKLQIALSLIFSKSPFNRISGKGPLGIAGSGIAWSYAQDVISDLDMDIRTFKVGTPYPFPAKLAESFLDGLDAVLVLEELDPVVEEALLEIAGSKGLKISILGKKTGNTPYAGEFSYELVHKAISDFAGLPNPDIADPAIPTLPSRIPVLCAGCPHRASFYAVKKAMKGQKAVFTGDIGCYTLGNAKPLSMVDTCLCMGASISVAQGIKRIEPDTRLFAFIGDSTFFHTGIPGVINAVYNQTDIVIVVLDNGTTAMTGHQPHPGTANTMMGNISEKIDIEALLKSVGVKWVRKVNPFDQKTAILAAKEASVVKGVSAIIFEAPCIALVKKPEPLNVDSEKCRACGLCIREIGCPAMVLEENGRVRIEPSACYACGLCGSVCPFEAIGGMSNED
ncbi:MAG: indolepyruvate ferredoxin oxidoreductase subunit alpha [Clostridiaceae bacterium]|jgi:indolepyruvate ferredoxin oxidoreductase alpha subunit|nr:indolepyruvate ferredoxin oxidoreductase subunit alpha [Clostridiaceae bacterium]